MLEIVNFSGINGHGTSAPTSTSRSISVHPLRPGALAQDTCQSRR